MITQQYLDSIKQVFPEVKDTQILKDIDKAQKLFANETGLLTAVGQLSTPSSNVGWNLTDDFVEMYGVDPVRFYDSSGNPKYLGDYQYGYEIQFNKFYIYSLTETTITGLSTGIDSAYIHYRRLPTTISSENTALEIEEEFRDAIEHYILKNYFAKFPVDMIAQGQIIKARDWNAVRFHAGEYEKLRIRAKRYANIKIQDNESYVQNYEYAGKYQLPRRTKDSTLGSTSLTQLTSLGTIYSKFALYNINTGDSGVINETIQVGYTTIAGSKTGVTFTISSTAEFGADTFLECNDGNASWVRNSSSEIVVTLPSSFTSLSLQLYEYS
jgi:hypothetical protein